MLYLICTCQLLRVICLKSSCSHQCWSHNECQRIHPCRCKSNQEHDSHSHLHSGNNFNLIIWARIILPDKDLLHTHWYQSRSSFLCKLVDIDTALDCPISYQAKWEFLPIIFGLPDSHWEDHCSNPHSDRAYPCSHQYQYHSFFQSTPFHKDSHSHW